MSKKILKTLSLVCLVSLFSSNIALAEGNLEENSQPEISPLSGTIFTIHGGSGAWELAGATPSYRETSKGTT